MKGIISFLAAIFAIISVPAVYASEQSPYDSGYNHGCDDARESPSDRYINEEGKGPSNHTPEFMNGYNAGFSNCSGGSGSSSSDGESRENLGSKLCRLIDTNRGAATLLAIALGYPGLDQAARALCGAMAD
jgi:hypothetical protein